MNFNKLVIENFGLFEGKNIFDLSLKKDTSDPGRRHKKTIILFGGKNGAGKTTIFEAFKLCLYGSSLDQFRWKKTDYLEYIRKKIHRNPYQILQPVSAAISLEFEYSRLGNKDNYKIERRWHISDKNIDEQFLIYVNGSLFEDLDNLHWQDFIREIIPIGISNLFFFDGEQIQSLADDSTDEQRLKNSFYSLLGLDVVDRLASDLAIHISRNEKHNDEKFVKKIDELYLERQKFEEEISQLVQDGGDLRNKLENRRKRIEEIQQKISSEGGAFAKKRDKLDEDKNALSTRISQIEEEIRQSANGVLPFAIVPKYCKSLGDRILKEQMMSRNLEYGKKQNELLSSLKNEIADSINNIHISNLERKNFSSFSKSDKRELIKIINKVIDNALYSNDSQNSDGLSTTTIKIINHLSTIEQNRILHHIEEALTIGDKIKNLSQELESTTIKLQKVESTLKQAPKDDVIGPLVDQLTTINQEIGQFQTMIRQIDEKISSLRYKQKIVDSQLQQISSDQKDFEIKNRGLKLAFKIREALKDYEKQTKKERIIQLEESLLDCLNELLHKEIFHKVKIDPELFTVSLFDKADNMIIKDQLSLGEKQIYAIAMLWALARSSGKPLPFIIDTPLGRLDSDHRLNLVQSFFPFASHQVIIFSTDTEIDREYFDDLSEYISHSYRLKYSSKSGSSEVEEGYFWNNDDESVREEKVTKSYRPQNNSNNSSKNDYHDDDANMIDKIDSNINNIVQEIGKPLPVNAKINYQESFD